MELSHHVLKEGRAPCSKNTVSFPPSTSSLRPSTLSPSSRISTKQGSPSSRDGPREGKSDAPPGKALGAFDTDTRRGDVSTVAEEVDAAQVVADTLYREVKDLLREECKTERTARVESFRHSVRDAFSRLEARVGLALVLWRLGRLEKARGTIKPKPRRQRSTD